MITHWSLNKRPPFCRWLSNAFYWTKVIVFWFRLHWILLPRAQLIKLVQVMAWHRTGDKPLSEMTQFIDVGWSCIEWKPLAGWKSSPRQFYLTLCSFGWPIQLCQRHQTIRNCRVYFHDILNWIDDYTNRLPIVNQLRLQSQYFASQYLYLTTASVNIRYFAFRILRSLTRPVMLCNQIHRCDACLETAQKSLN